MSKFIIGSDRSQIPLFASSMDQAIAQDNQILLIDLFVDSLKLADVGLIFTAYNLKRIFNLVDLNMLKMYLKRTALFYWINTTLFKAFYDFVKFELNVRVFYKRRNYCSGNGLYLLQN